MKKLQVPYCPACNGTNLWFDACAEWSTSEQCMVLASDHDHCECADCEGETTPGWRSANPEELADIAAQKSLERLNDAASDLLDALEKMIALHDEYAHSEYDGTSMVNEQLAYANFARVAVAKARGVQS